MNYNFIDFVIYTMLAVQFLSVGALIYSNVQLRKVIKGF